MMIGPTAHPAPEIRRKLNGNIGSVIAATYFESIMPETKNRAQRRMREHAIQHIDAFRSEVEAIAPRLGEKTPRPVGESYPRSAVSKAVRQLLKRF